MQRDSNGHDNARVTIDPSTRVTPGSADGRVLLHLESGRMCAINGMGSRIWSEIEAGRSFAEIVAVLATEFEAPREAIDDDVRAFIEKLVSKDYVHVPGAGQ